MKQKAIWLYWILAGLLPLLAVIQALSLPIEEYAYDTAEFHIYRGVVYSAARADGWLYPRWVQPINAGLGGPFFSLYPPLVYSLMDVLNIFGVPHPAGWRVLVALALFAGSTGMFGLALALVRRADAALASAALFVYSGPLLRDLFERGAPSGMALALFPALLWFLIRFVQSPSGLYLLLGALALAAIILLHSQTAFLLLPLVAVVFVFLFMRDGLKRAALALAPLIGGVLLAAFYLLPFPIQVKQVQFENALVVDYANPAAHPLRLEDLLALPRPLDVGIGNNAMGLLPGGLIHALALLVGLALAWTLWRQARRAEAVLLAGLALLGIGVLWMQLAGADPVWSALPSLDVFLFRWRLLGVLGIITAVVGGYALARTPVRIGQALGAGIIVVYVALHLGLLYPQLLYHYTRFPTAPSLADVDKSALEHGIFGLASFDEFVPISRGAPIDAAEFDKVKTSPVENLPAGGRIMSQVQRTGLLELKIETPVPFVAAIRTLYYPGWFGYLDGRSRRIEAADPSGYILMNVPAGTHTVAIKYEGTPVQRLADFITVVTFGVLLVLAVVWRRTREAASAGAITIPQLHWSILPLYLFVVALKVAWLDPSTTLFRTYSTCSAIAEARVQTDVRFGERLRLCGYTLDSSGVRPGDRLGVTLYWQLDQPANERVHAFVHMIGGTMNPETGGPVWAQQDKENPGDLYLPQWQTGYVYRDRYEFRVPRNAPPAEYQLEIGWWTPSNQERLAPRLVRSTDALSVSSLDSLLVSSIAVR